MVILDGVDGDTDGGFRAMAITGPLTRLAMGLSGLSHGSVARYCSLSRCFLDFEHPFTLCAYVPL